MADQQGTRRVAVLTHIGREDAMDAAARFVTGLIPHQIGCVLPADDIARLGDRLAGVAVEVLSDSHNGASCELAVVFGGDGTILRGAEWAVEADIALLGVNLGHVGFLAEAESSEIDATIAAVVDRSYRVEERLIVEVEVQDCVEGEVIWSTFAVNEASIEKGGLRRMLEVTLQVGAQPLSRWVCDGVLVSTPTGSTAYAFSAGGPVMWPGVEALLVVPISAHALFNRPLVFPPNRHVRVEIIDEPDNDGVVWCDGRRSISLSPGNVVTVTGGHRRLRLARLADSSFTDRLVRKFGLRVEGLRGGRG